MQISPFANAFEICENIAVNQRWAEDLRDTVLSRTPMRYLPIANSVNLITETDNETFYPFAARSHSLSIVVFPRTFAVVACRLAIAYSARLHGSGALDSVIPKITDCLDGGVSPPACLISFSEEIQRDYSSEFKSRPTPDRDVTTEFARTLIAQLLMHEYAHHFIANEAGDSLQSDPTTEFLADMFAVLNGVSAGDPPSTMMYLFWPLARATQAQSSPRRTTTHEDYSCRHNNVQAITNHLGLLAYVVRGAAAGRAFSFLKPYGQEPSAEGVRELARESIKGFDGTPSIELCSLLNISAVKVFAGEIRELYDRLEPELDWLFADAPKLDGTYVKSLVVDLVAMATRFRFASSLAGNVVSSILRRTDDLNLDLALRFEIQEAVASINTNDSLVLSADFGRLKLFEGKNALDISKATGSKEASRIAFDLFEQSAKYNPKLASAWLHLMLMAADDNRCREASRYAEKVRDTAAEKVIAQQFADIALWLRDAPTCRSESKPRLPEER